jgi:Zn finger protein HypA/HybF involved in hydrogenase expression
MNIFDKDMQEDNLILYKCYWCDEVFVYDGLEEECPCCGSDDVGIYMEEEQK